jgi:hypothetical protein
LALTAGGHRGPFTDEFGWENKATGWLRALVRLYTFVAHSSAAFAGVAQFLDIFYLSAVISTGSTGHSLAQCWQRWQRCPQNRWHQPRCSRRPSRQQELSLPNAQQQGSRASLTNQHLREVRKPLSRWPRAGSCNCQPSAAGRLTVQHAVEQRKAELVQRGQVLIGEVHGSHGWGDGRPVHDVRLQPRQISSDWLAQPGFFASLSWHSTLLPRIARAQKHSSTAVGRPCKFLCVVFTLGSHVHLP